MFSNVADVFHEWPQVFNLRVSTSGAALVQVENLHPLSTLKTCTHFLS
jgi:hypothetical protein